MSVPIPVFPLAMAQILPGSSNPGPSMILLGDLLLPEVSLWEVRLDKGKEGCSDNPLQLHSLSSSEGTQM